MAGSSYGILASRKTIHLSRHLQSSDVFILEVYVRYADTVTESMLLVIFPASTYRGGKGILKACIV